MIKSALIKPYNLSSYIWSISKKRNVLNIKFYFLKSIADCFDLCLKLKLHRWIYNEPFYFDRKFLNCLSTSVSAGNFLFVMQKRCIEVNWFSFFCSKEFSFHQNIFSSQNVIVIFTFLDINDFSFLLLNRRLEREMKVPKLKWPDPRFCLHWNSFRSTFLSNF